uniref:Uncharacterized protein n=1 Tax=Anopheles maculatus TaxID=74869 RepID=A0A182TCI3_9DIPT
MELTHEIDSKALCDRIQGVLRDLGTTKVVTEMADVIVRNADHLTQEGTLKEVLRVALTKEPTVSSIRMWELADATTRARVRLARVKAEAIMGRANPLLIDHSAGAGAEVGGLATSMLPLLGARPFGGLLHWRGPKPVLHKVRRERPSSGPMRQGGTLYEMWRPSSNCRAQL